MVGFAHREENNRRERYRREKSGLRPQQRKTKKKEAACGRILKNFLFEKRKFDKENQCQAPEAPGKNGTAEVIRILEG